MLAIFSIKVLQKTKVLFKKNVVESKEKLSE